MNKKSITAFLLLTVAVFSCDQLDDKAVLGLPFELSESFTVNIQEGEDSVFSQVLTIDPQKDSSVVSNIENFNGIEISELYYKISGVTTAPETIFGLGYIGYGLEENTMLDTLVVLDSLNITDIKGEDYIIPLKLETVEQLNSLLSTGDPFYIFTEGAASETPVKFTLTMWAELILRVGV